MHLTHTCSAVRCTGAGADIDNSRVAAKMGYSVTRSKLIYGFRSEDFALWCGVEHIINNTRVGNTCSVQCCTTARCYVRLHSRKET